MKKVLILFAAIALAFTLTACTEDCEPETVTVEVEVEVPAELPAIPEVVDMDNLDDYLGRPDVQYVDLRNFDDKMNGGYIAGFEFIPFFQYLENEEVLVRTNSWTFEAAGIKNQTQLENLFDDSKTIFLMCGSGTRAGFVLDALESIGYDNVINVGGISSYDGDNRVLGDGSFALPTELAAIPEVVDMSNIDMYLGRPDVQYVDLRNFDDKMNSGYIAGFEFIPFFDYLEHEEVLVRTNSWTFEAAGIMNQAQLENLFDADKTIFLMCGSGTRAGFVLDALESIGYTNVINVGGISSYSGDNKVLGDGTFTLNHPASGPYTPGTYFAVDPQSQYTATIVVGMGGAIEDVVFDALYHGTTKNTLDTAYTLGSGVTWKAEAAELAAYVLANQGWGDITLDITDISTSNYLTAPRHFVYIDHANSPDDVAGVTIGAEGFVLAWNLAIAQAGGTPVAGVPTSQEWVDAHAPAFDYEDGVYFGDTDSGYTVRVTIEEGIITDVYFDAVRVVYTINDNGTVGDESDDFVEFTTMSTKQALQDGYTLASGFTWAQEADELAAAIVDAQQWDPLWVIILGGEGEHDDFDMTDAYTADAVGGVTIGMEGFKEAFEEAIAKAAPVSE